MRVEELMARKVETIGRNDDLHRAEEIMRDKRIRHLPVLEEGRLVGVLTQRDLFDAAMSNALGYGSKARSEFLRTVPVKEAMKDEVVTIGPKENATRAAELMLEHKIGCLPVVEGGKLVGLVTETDLLRLIVK